MHPRRASWSSTACVQSPPLLTLERADLSLLHRALASPWSARAASPSRATCASATRPSPSRATLRRCALTRSLTRSPSSPPRADPGLPLALAGLRRDRPHLLWPARPRVRHDHGARQAPAARQPVRHEGGAHDRARDVLPPRVEHPVRAPLWPVLCRARRRRCVSSFPHPPLASVRRGERRATLTPPACAALSRSQDSTARTSRSSPRPTSSAASTLRRCVAHSLLSSRPPSR